ncbi:MAG: hypothetical protein ACTS6P_01145 [Candidatus Hodgkinia cicadicola]
MPSDVKRARPWGVMELRWVKFNMKTNLEKIWTVIDLANGSS